MLLNILTKSQVAGHKLNLY